ncbi:N-acyl amino acid synthase FeeM domain-containing protein [Pseudomonas sp. S1_E04]
MTFITMPLLSADRDAGSEQLDAGFFDSSDHLVCPINAQMTLSDECTTDVQVTQLTEYALVIVTDRELTPGRIVQVGLRDDIADKDVLFKVQIIRVTCASADARWTAQCSAPIIDGKPAWPRCVRNLYQRLRVDREMWKENRRPGDQLKRSLGRHAMAQDIHLSNAATVDDRESAYRLVYSAYFRKGLAEPKQNGLFTNAFLLNPETVTFIGKVSGEVAMTVTSIPDSDDKLPMDAVFEDCLAPLRKEGRVLAEFGMLAVDPSYFGAIAYTVHDPEKMVNVYSLFRIALQHAKFCKGYTDIMFAIPPKHQALYRFMGVSAISETRYYSKYNTPAVAMRIDLLALDLRAHVQEFLFGTPIAQLSAIGRTEWPEDALIRIFGDAVAVSA